MHTGMASSVVLALLLSTGVALAQYNALGTLGVERGGSCGFTDAYPPPGVFIGSFSAAIYGNGAQCGACYVASCVNSVQCTNQRVIFTVVNQCLGENTTSPCVTGRHGVSLQPEAFDVIASSRDPGIVPIRYFQVPCQNVGGVYLEVQQDSSANYFAVLLQNVGGPGSLTAVELSTDGATFQPLARSYGSVWAITNPVGILGKPLTLRLTGLLNNRPQQLVLPNAIPANWEPKVPYPTRLNFNLVPARPAKKMAASRIPLHMAAAYAVSKKAAAKRPAKKVAVKKSLIPAILTPARTAMATLGEDSGGACGFLNYPAPATYRAGFSNILYREGASCGACYSVSCTNSAQCKPGAVVVQVSNQCTATNTTSVCMEGQPGINMQPEAWDLIVSTRSPGIVSVSYQQVACQTAPLPGGVQFLIRDGSPMYFATLIQNVGGAGNLVGVDIAFGNGGFMPMTRSYGSVWARNGQVLFGVPVSFKLTTVGGYSLIIRNALPANWIVGKRLYSSGLNF